MFVASSKCLKYNLTTSSHSSEKECFSSASLRATCSIAFSHFKNLLSYCPNRLYAIASQSYIMRRPAHPALNQGKLDIDPESFVLFLKYLALVPFGGHGVQKIKSNNSNFAFVMCAIFRVIRVVNLRKI